MSVWINAFLPLPTIPCQGRIYQRHQRIVPKCTAQPPNDPGELRSESSRRRNSPPKPLRRKKRRKDMNKDWNKMETIPLVRPDASPESGEDYWLEIDDSIRLSDADGSKIKKSKKEIDPNLKSKLKKEVVSPYTQNWLLRAVLIVFVLIALVAIFGGEETIPIIKLPDL